MALLQWSKLIQSIVSTFEGGQMAGRVLPRCHATGLCGTHSWATWRYALATQPVAVAGPEGGWVVDLISNRATVIRAAAGTIALLIVVGCWHFGFVPSFLEACLFAANGLAVFLYGLDKLASKIGTRRAPEASLVALGCLGGWPAAYIAQFIFRHKTQKLNFQIACLASVIQFDPAGLLSFRRYLINSS